MHCFVLDGVLPLRRHLVRWSAFDMHFEPVFIGASHEVLVLHEVVTPSSCGLCLQFDGSSLLLGVQCVLLEDSDLVGQLQFRRVDDVLGYDWCAR